MDIKEIKKMPEKELKRKLNERRDKLRDFRFNVESRHLKDVRVIRTTKKDIAKILTVLNQLNQIKK